LASVRSSWAGPQSSKDRMTGVLDQPEDVFVLVDVTARVFCQSLLARQEMTTIAIMQRTSTPAKKI
jgi:hypothetical protein